MENALGGLESCRARHGGKKRGEHQRAEHQRSSSPRARGNVNVIMMWCTSVVFAKGMANGNLREQRVKALADELVALTGRPFQTFTVSDRDVPMGVLDESSLLQRGRDDADAGTSDAEHDR